MAKFYFKNEVESHLIILSRLLDIISGHYEETPYFYSPAQQLQEECA